MRGEVKDESGNVLQNVSIEQIKTGYVFKTGGAGTFGIICAQKADTFCFSLEGFSKEKLYVDADHYVSVQLKKLPAAAASTRRDKLSSLTKNLARDEQKSWYSGDETYASLLENHFVNARRFPSTGMSVNVDRASYSNIRRFITMNAPVPPDAVRIEEMLNYFNLSYQQPDPGKLFKINSVVSDCPWNKTNQLFYLNLSSQKLDLDTLPPSNLVFLIDVSGSMDMPNRLPLLKSAFKLLVNNLRNKDSVAIVAYGGVTGVMLHATSGAEKDTILKVIENLEPEGATPGESGIRMAYTEAKNHFIKGGNNRVILATDGDFNVGLKSEEELDSLISTQKESGIYLTCLGVGMGNYKDSKIQTLAQKGKGNFAYLDNYREAEKVLLREFTQTLYAVADEVYLNVEFNPDYVKEYRLLGFDNKVGALKDSLSLVEGGEVGSGYSMIAVFEIVPADENKGDWPSANAGRFADIRMTFHHPGKKTECSFSCQAQYNYSPVTTLDKNYRFSSAVALFGAMLRNSAFIKDADWDDIISIGQQSSQPGDQLQQEFIALVQQAKKLYSPKSRKRKNNEKER